MLLKQRGEETVVKPFRRRLELDLQLVAIFRTFDHL